MKLLISDNSGKTYWFHSILRIREQGLRKGAWPWIGAQDSSWKRVFDSEVKVRGGEVLGVTRSGAPGNPRGRAPRPVSGVTGRLP